MSNKRTSRATTVLAVLSLVAIQNTFMDTARAEAKTIGLKHISFEELKNKCDAAGGSFDSIGKTDYWCQGKDGTTSVTCDTKNCTGVTTSASAPAPKQFRDPQIVLDALSAQ